MTDKKYEDEIEKYVCGECDGEVECEDDLLPYEEIQVCISCHDELKRIDEQKVIEWETEGYGEYD